MRARTVPDPLPLDSSLAPGGMLIAPLKDRTRYQTFDYHWLSRWTGFFQRTEAEFRQVFRDAGIADRELRVERDGSGVILFFLVEKP